MYKNSKCQPPFSSIQPIDRTLSGASTLGLSGPGSDGNEEVLHIPQSWNLTIRLFSATSRTLVGGGVLTLLQRCSWCILQPQPNGQIVVLDFFHFLGFTSMPAKLVWNVLGWPSFS